MINGQINVGLLSKNINTYFPRNAKPSVIKLIDPTKLQNLFEATRALQQFIDGREKLKNVVTLNYKYKITCITNSPQKVHNLYSNISDRLAIIDYVLQCYININKANIYEYILSIVMYDFVPIFLPFNNKVIYQMKQINNVDSLRYSSQVTEVHYTLIRFSFY